MGQIKNIKLHIVTDIKLSSVLSTSREIRNGQVKEPHRTQPKCEESSQWYQETTTEQVPFTERCRSQVLEEPAVCEETQQECQEVDASREDKRSSTFMKHDIELLYRLSVVLLFCEMKSTILK